LRNNLKGSKISKVLKRGAFRLLLVCPIVHEFISQCIFNRKCGEGTEAPAGRQSRCEDGRSQQEKKLCRVSPGSTVVAKWIQQANNLEEVIRY